MKIKHNNEVTTPTHKEFRCLGNHSEYYLYQADKVDNQWQLSNSPAGVKQTLGNFKTPMEAITAALIHANS
jgi:hypothetical protein